MCSVVLHYFDRDAVADPGGVLGGLTPPPSEVQGNSVYTCSQIKRHNVKISPFNLFCYLELLAFLCTCGVSPSRGFPSLGHVVKLLLLARYYSVHI